MLKVHIVIGDMLEAVARKDVDFFAHGCNCHKSMGAGIAKKIADNWPEMRIVDAVDNRGPMSRYGSFTRAYLNSNGVIGFNLYTQLNPGPNADMLAVQTSLYSSLESIGVAVRETRIPKPIELFAMPAIGCGIGGLGLIQTVLSITSVFIRYNERNQDTIVPIMFLQPGEYVNKLAVLKLWGYTVHQSIEEVHLQYGLSM